MNGGGQSHALFAHMHAEQLRGSWEARALVAARGRTRAVLLAIFANEWPQVLPTVLRVAFDDFEDIETPFLKGHATIQKSGAITCEMIDESYMLVPAALVYGSKEEFTADFRRLADRLKLNDAERTELFKAAARWITADLRFDHEGRQVGP